MVHVGRVRLRRRFMVRDGGDWPMMRRNGSAAARCCDSSCFSATYDGSIEEQTASVPCKRQPSYRVGCRTSAGPCRPLSVTRHENVFWCPRAQNLCILTFSSSVSRSG